VQVDAACNSSRTPARPPLLVSANKPHTGERLRLKDIVQGRRSPERFDPLAARMGQFAPS